MANKVIAFLQARTDSTRLPGKVLKSILGKPMIIHQLERVKKSVKINTLVLLTSDENSDDKLVDIVTGEGFQVFRGSKQDVLQRFFCCADALKLANDDLIVRLTGDCPVLDAAIIDEAISFFESQNVDYIANCVQPIYPDGFDVEVFTFKALKSAYENAPKPSQREHVTPYIRDSGEFRIAHLPNPTLYTNWRLTVDENKDFLLINTIFEHFGHNQFSYTDIIQFLEKRPDLLSLNKFINRNEGYMKSLQEESIFNEQSK